MADGRIDLAIVGAGKIARDQHVPTLARGKDFRLAATVSPHGGLAGLPNFATLAAMVSAGRRPAAVAVCTPPQARAALAREALALGFDVLLEKPPAATLSAFSALKHQAKASGRVLFAAWHSRFAPMVEPARAWLAARTVTAGRVIWREDVRRWHPGQAWLWAPGGLGVFDPGINALSILSHILPPASLTVDAARLWRPANAQTPIAAQLRLKAEGAAIDMDLDFRQTGEQTWTIQLDTACGHSLRLLDGGARMAIDDAAPSGASGAEYAGVYARFAELIRARVSDADAAPLRLVADALLVAETDIVEAFSD